MLRAQGNLTDALAAYQAALAIRERLAKADPANAGWQRDVASSYGRVAMVEAQRENRERALAGYRHGREIIKVLRARSPDDATLPRDLAWFDARISALQDM